jgi:hypothetical protein
MKTLTTIDFSALASVTGGGQQMPLGAPALNNPKTSKVCSTANGSYDGGAAVPGGTWQSRQCIDPKSNALHGSYQIVPSSPPKQP